MKTSFSKKSLSFLIILSIVFAQNHALKAMDPDDGDNPAGIIRHKEPDPRDETIKKASAFLAIFTSATIAFLFLNEDKDEDPILSSFKTDPQLGVTHYIATAALCVAVTYQGYCAFRDALRNAFGRNPDGQEEENLH